MDQPEMMTHFLRDILRQPNELRGTIDFLSGVGRHRLDEATAAVRGVRHVYLTGIGSSWHAALSVEPLFSLGGRPVYMRDAAELLQFATLPPDAVLIVISRSGRSVEIVDLLVKARESGATVIGVTNAEDGTLAREAQIPLVIPTKLDHGISVNTYTTLAAGVGALATATVGSFDSNLAQSLLQVLVETESAMVGWQQQIADTAWLLPNGVYYFLARGPGLGSCNEARLMWEEGVKSPATAMGTGSFRHGPQEMVAKNMRFGLWIDGRRMREPDLAVARDLRHLGASVMLVGQHLPESAADLVFRLPEVPADWQFLIDIIPAQLAAESLSRLSGVDCDSFKLCPYIVEDDSGLLGG
jgi:glucosamine--fructose-6-phosphate aminotransferase (isomerizing)